MMHLFLNPLQAALYTLEQNVLAVIPIIDRFCYYCYEMLFFHHVS